MVRLQPLFPKSHGKLRIDDSRMLSGIIFFNCNGLKWRSVPRDRASCTCPVLAMSPDRKMYFSGANPRVLRTR